jgi:3-oxoadipate enol-lactonase
VPFIDANGVSLNYELAGAPGRAVVLLHELGGTLQSWDAVAPLIAGRFRVLRYDQRGAGLSEKVRQEFSNDVLVEDFEALCGAVGLDPPYHFVTVAAAATQALRFLEKKPDQVGALVLCNPAPGVDKSRAAVLDERAAFAAREGMRAALPTTLALSYPPNLGERAAYQAYLGRYLANDPVCFGFGFRVLARTNMLHMLPQIRCPAMVVAGRHDTVRPHAGSAELAKRIPGARFELIEDAGHFMPTQAPRALAALLEDFLPR